MKCVNCVYYYAKENDLFTTCHFTPRGTVLVKKIDPNEFFIKTDTTDEGNAMYLDNGELFFVDNNEICCEVKHKLIIEE